MKINDVVSLRSKLLTSQSCRVHTALSRGYIRKGESFIERYEGRLGKGYKIHYANRDFYDYCHSNSFHRVEYILV